MKANSEKLWLGIAIIVIAGSFVAPALVANTSLRSDLFLAVLGFLLYCASWMFIAEGLFMSAAHLYGLRRKSLFMFEWPAKYGSAKEARFWRLASIPLCLLSYAFTIYGFAMAFLFLSLMNHSAFNVGELSFFSAIYFSVVTAATVGYGDILPLSTGARLLVIAEIGASLLFVIFFFSVLSGTFARALRPKRRH